MFRPGQASELERLCETYFEEKKTAVFVVCLCVFHVFSPRLW